VLADNAAMLEIFDQLGSIRTDEGQGVYRIDVPLGDRAAEPPEATPHRVLRAMARGLAPPMRWRFPWTAVLKHRAGGEAADEDLPR
jgi:hypothetical protein